MASHHKTTTWTNDRILDPLSQKVKEKSSMTSHHQSTTWMDDKIIDQHFYKAKRYPPWRVTTRQRIERMIEFSIHISIKSRGNHQWCVTTSRRLGQMIQSSINISKVNEKSFMVSHQKSTTLRYSTIMDLYFNKSRRKLHKESPQVYDLDG